MNIKVIFEYHRKCLTDMRCFWGLNIFSIQNRSTISGFVSPCRQLILYRFPGFLGIHSHQSRCRQKAKIAVFHGNCDSFDTIFITVIQPKIHEGNALLKCFHHVFILICFYFKRSTFFLLIYFRSSRSLISFQKQPHAH